MERLKSIKETLMGCIQGQMSHLDSVDTKELGEAIDMVKDLEEAIYYCTITKAMEEQNDEKGKGPRTMVYFSEPKYHMYPEYRPYERDMDKDYGRMYYNGGRSSSNGSNGNGSNSSGTRYYSEREYPIGLRDYREGQSPMSRRKYMEAKEMHQDKSVQLQELETYMKELGKDVVEMIEDSSPEEKKYLANRIQALATKVQSLEND